ncbi:MAG: ATP-binding protein [Clostridia bacterium]|nr:ATP-binding protein [Clostridia bacterium]
MKQEILTKAINRINSKKFKNQNDFEQKMASLYADADFINLHAKYKRIIIENAKNEVLGENVDKELEKSLENRIFELKKKHCVENVELTHSCPLCKDEGYVNGDMCKCLKREISEILLTGSGFEKLENFECSIKTSGKLEPVYNLMQQWCKSDFKKSLIFLSGGTGVGKTHLMQCMANELIERGMVVKVVTSFQLNQDFKDFSKCYDDDILNKYLECEVLFIDDLGTEPVYKNVTINYLYLIINERRMKKRPTVITSNLLMSDLYDHYDERIYSRIADRRTSINILLEGEDKRLK